MNPLCRLICAMVLAFASLADARVIHVRGDARDSREEGSAEHPFRTITRAVEAAGPGDIVKVTPIPEGYRETVDFYRHPGGEPGRPVTLDGQGAELIGTEKVDPAGWEREGELWVRSDLLPKLFLVVDGKMIFETHAGETLEPGEFAFVNRNPRRLVCRRSGPKALPPPLEAELESGARVRIAPGQWERTSDPGQLRFRVGEKVTALGSDGGALALVRARDRLRPGQWCEEEGRFYYRPAEGKTPGDLAMEACVRMNGIQIGGTTSHLVIRHFNARHFYNDGYNIHGKARHLEFYDCNAMGMGDEGFSAHTDCETLADGAYYEYCGTGVGNMSYTTGSAARTVTRNVVIRAARTDGFRAGIRAAGVQHRLEGAIILDCSIGMKIGRGVEADQVVVLASGERRGVQLEGGGSLSGVAVSVGGRPLSFLGAGDYTVSRGWIRGGAPMEIRSAPQQTIALRELSIAGELELTAGEGASRRTIPVAEGLEPYGATVTFVANHEPEGFPGVRLAPPETAGPEAALLERALREWKNPVTHAQRVQTALEKNRIP